MIGKLDGTDLRILALLQENAEHSIGEIAEAIHLSQNACWRRIRQLEEGGYILKRVALLDAVKLGAGMTVFVMVGLSGQLRRDALAFERAMADAPEVLECHNITGSVEYLLRVEVADLAAYKHFHSDVLGTLSQVSSITSHVSLGSSKDLRA